jgi:uncharacterized protein (TIGR00369 family)
MYHDAPINRESRPRLRVSDGKAEIRVDIDSKMHHAAAAVHGAIYFKALDDAAFFAANSLVDDVLVLTTSFTIYMLRPVSEGRLVARGRVTHRTGRLFFAEATLEDQDENSIARGSGTFMRSGISLGPEVRYR